MSASHTWETRRLADCGQLVSGGTPSKKKPEYWGGVIPWFSSKEVRNFDLDDSELHVTTIGAEKGAKLIPPGTVLFVIRGMSLANEFRVGVTTVDATFNQDVKGLVPAEDVDGRYVARCLSWRAPQVLRATGQASHGTKRLEARVFDNIQIPLPPIAEQRRIASILDKADAIRRKRKEAIALVEGLQLSAFLDMFGDPVANPKRWETKTLSDLRVEFAYGTSTKCNDDKTGRGVLRIPNVVDGEVRLDGLKYAQLDAKEASRFTLDKGDLLFVRTNGNANYIARCAVFSMDKPMLFASYLIRARLPKKCPVTPAFVHAVFSCPSFRAQLLREATTTAGNYNINTKGLGRQSVPLPPIELQKRFVSVTNRIRSLRAREEVTQLNSDQLFGSLLSRAFSERAACSEVAC